jgi:hypothetical protein
MNLQPVAQRVIRVEYRGGDLKNCSSAVSLFSDSARRSLSLASPASAPSSSPP